MNRIKQFFCGLFALLSLSSTVYAIVKFIIFTSKPREIIKPIADDADNGEWKFAARSLVNNAIWLVLFILQHSFQRHEYVKELWKKIHLSTIERASYNLLSSFFLLQLILNWQSLDNNRWTLWSVSATTYSPIWWGFILIHTALWIVIVGGSLLMDLPELLGIKQVYYDMQDLNEPSLYKAPALNRFLSHIRHPSYVGFSSLFWVTNLMSLDRFILAALLTAYMFVAWSPDRKDYAYQQQQLEIKKLELHYDLKQKWQ